MPKTLAAVSALTGTIIGAGILGIPFVVMKSGFTLGLLNIILLGTIIIITSLYLGEIMLRTKSDHQLTGYAEKYLGEKGKSLMFLATAFGILAALTAYLMGEGESLSYLIFGSSLYKTHLTLFFWVALSSISYYGLKALKRGEEIGLTLVIIFLCSILIFYSSDINVQNLSYNNTNNILSPFGVVLFSLLGFSAIPELKRLLGKNKNLIKKSVISAYVIAIIIYIIFTLVVLGVKGKYVPEIATLALGKPFIVLGIVTMFTAYLCLTTALIDTLRLDFNLTKNKSWLITILIPLLIFTILNVTNNASFVKIIGIGGAISGGLTTLLILIMFHKAKYLGDRRPEYTLPYSKILTLIIILIFTLGIISEIMSAFSF